MPTLAKAVYSHVAEWVCRRHNWPVVFEVKLDTNNQPMSSSVCPVCGRAGQQWRKYTRG